MNGADCRGCRFFLAHHTYKDQPGRCRRFPPRYVGGSDSHPRYPQEVRSWGGYRAPEVMPSEWCGEHQPRGEEP